MNCDIRSNIKDVIFSYPATIILWKDGTKTIVKAGKDEKYDPEKGFAMAVCNKMFGNEGNYYEVFKEYVPIDHYVADKKDTKTNAMMTDLAVSDEVDKEIIGMIDKCQEKGKIWPGLTRQKWKELISKVVKHVEEKQKREAAERERICQLSLEVNMSNYMTPPEDETNNSDGEE